jgi:adenosylcobinamide-GDP ribazoletransferase
MIASLLKTQAYAFASAVRFLSVIPLPPLPGEAQGDWRRHLSLSLFFYPLVGLLLGSIFLLVALRLESVFQPALLAATVLGVWVFLSGALHLDGLADCADAWVGGLGSKEKTLAIMKDPACGPVGVSVIVVLLLLKFSALLQLLSSGFPVVYLIIPPLLGRLAIVLMRLTTPYVREGGLGQEVFASSPTRPLIVQCVVIVGVLTFFFLDVFIVLLVASALIFFIVRKVSMARLSGCTGDVLGAMVELTELASLLALCLYF